MSQTKSIVQEKINNNPYLFVNLVFAFFPISFILGSLFVNVNLLLFCCLGIFYLRSKILSNKYDFSIKIIFLFFLLIFFSTGLSLAKTLYFQGYDSINVVASCVSTNCYSPLVKLTKSILFFRFFLLLIIIYLLSKFNILNFKYFFLTAAFASVLTSLDIIYQYVFGFDIIGLKGSVFHNSGFFGDEYIAGGYILRFAFFAIFFTVLVFKNTNYTKLISTVTVICILTTAILFAGNRMPVILFAFGLFLILLFNLKIKKILFVSLIAMFILLKFIILSDETYKSHIKNVYSIFGTEASTLMNMTVMQKWSRSKNIMDDKFIRTKTLFIEAKYEGLHRRIFLTAIDTWKVNKIFGNGIKSFREDCWKLEKQPDINLGENLMTGKKNRLCSNHPHNYYLEILTETGIIGLFIVSIIALMFIVFIFKNLKFIKQISIENFILLSAIISLILETLPLRSTGSLFSTNSAAYLILISSIVLSHKTLMKINNSK